MSDILGKSLSHILYAGSHTGGNDLNSTEMQHSVGERFHSKRRFIGKYFFLIYIYTSNSLWHLNNTCTLHQQRYPLCWKWIKSSFQLSIPNVQNYNCTFKFYQCFKLIFCLTFWDIDEDTCMWMHCHYYTIHCNSKNVTSRSMWLSCSFYIYNLNSMKVLSIHEVLKS